jgi:3-phenylpropionate/trans-cinnamate dioxygenase ferredoxin reductase component
MTAAGVVIVGSGHAGFETAAALRRGGFDERIVLVGDEPTLPYQRPPLSKGFLTGKTSHESLWFRPREFYERHGIELLHGERATAVDRTARTVALASGSTVTYDHLVLATGARPRLLPVPGADLEGVLLLRTLADAEALADLLRTGGKAVVVGGGFIGLELAAVASSLGVEVAVIEALPRLMPRAVTQEVAVFYAREHKRWGVQILLESGVTRLRSVDGHHVRAVETRDGRRIPADVVVIAIGIEPDLRLAEECGLPVQNGVIVDESLRTADPRIFAVGDCASFPSALTGTHVRLESVQNAADHGSCVAAHLTGRGSPYRAVPWFWSDQRDVRLQMAGLGAGHDQVVVRGDPAERSFSVFWFKSGILLGGESVNRPGDHMVIRRLLGAERRRAEDLTPEQAADLAFDLKATARPVPDG